MTFPDTIPRLLSSVCIVALASLAGCAPATQPADLVLHNGKVVTVDPDRPEAQALATRDGRIVAVGSDEEIARLIGNDTEVIDLEGRLAVPGFIEGHGHFAGLGLALTVIDLTQARSWDEIVELVAAGAADAPEGRWIYGQGWHQEEWDEPPAPNVEGFPVHDALSAAVPDHAVVLKHAAGSHAGIVNRRAMQLLGIESDMPDPVGGRILHDSDGEPTGVLIDEAFRVAKEEHERQLELEDANELRHRLRLANDECLSKGVTSFQDAGSRAFEIDAMRELSAAAELDVRLWIMLHGDHFDDLAAAAEIYGTSGRDDAALTVRAIKMVGDGALGSRSAWLIEPYSDQPDTTGLSVAPIEEIEAAARVALDHDMQLCVHAIGDRANREVLDLYERVWGGPRPELRWRVEHAQHLSRQDIPRFAELGVIAAMQGVHCTSDGGWVPQRLGEQRSAEGAYVWRDLLDSGAIVINGTDTSVEDVDPIANFHSTVTRRLPDGSLFYPEQRMTRTEALKSYTLDAAYGAFEEQIKGSLTPGKLADVVVLSQDIMTVPEDRILDTRVLYTIVGGRVVYRSVDVGGDG